MPYGPDYPTPAELSQLEGAQFVVRDDLLPVRSVNGTLKVRALYPTPKKAFLFRHPATLEQFADYRTFYDTYSRTTFTFTFSGDGTAYPNCLFGGPPQYTFTNSGCDIAVTIEQQ